jgi:hypothetical protein
MTRVMLTQDNAGEIAKDAVDAVRDPDAPYVAHELAIAVATAHLSNSVQVNPRVAVYGGMIGTVTATLLQLPLEEHGPAIAQLKALIDTVASHYAAAVEQSNRRVN